jgi:hypothetical protein
MVREPASTESLAATSRAFEAVSEANFPALCFHSFNVAAAGCMCAAAAVSW